ncbi:MAG TPA: EamA family transporter [Elusimicrobiota bacterium]|nr:EamA family transporter [Elusimicrobiota bacterium]
MNWKLYALGSAFFAGLTAVLAKLGVKDISSNLATLIRTLVIVSFLTPVVITRGEWKNPFILPKQSLTFLVLSGIATGFSWLCYFFALKNGPASVVAPIDKLSMVIAVSLSVLFLGERLTILQWTGIGFMTLGALLVIKL